MKGLKYLLLFLFIAFCFYFTNNNLKVQAVTIGSCEFVISSNYFNENNDIILLLGEELPNWDEEIEVDAECNNLQDAMVVSDNVNMNEVGKYNIKVFIIDNIGDNVTVDYDVYVRENITAPVLSGVVNREFELNGSLTRDKLLEGVEAIDDFDGDITSLIIVDYSQVDMQSLGEYPVTYAVSDQHNNNTTKTIFISIKDLNGPVITIHNLTYEVFSESPNWYEIVQVTDNIDPNPIVFCDSIDVKFYQLGTYDVTYTAYDSQQLKTEKTIIVNIVDTTKPVITVKNPVFKIFSSEPNWLNYAEISDNYDEDPEIIIDAGVNFNKTGNYQVKYTVTDSSGNVSIKIMTVFVVDLEAPILHNYHDFDYLIGTEEPDFLNGVYATDNTDGLITSEDINLIDKYVKLDVEGRHQLTYEVSDSSGNKTSVTVYVRVYDLIKPTLNGYHDFTILTKQSIDYLEGITAIDNVSMDISNWIVVDDSEVNLNQAGIYNLYYYIADRSGNHEEVTVKVIINADILSPVIHNLHDFDIEFGTSTIDYLEGITATDDNDKDVDLIVDSSLVDLTVLGQYAVTYTATDDSTNKTERTVYVNVTDTKTPIINGEKDVSIKARSKYDPLKGITASDNYDGDLTSQITVIGDYDVNKVGSYIITLKVVDSSGNEETETFTLKVTNNGFAIWYILGGTLLVGFSACGFYFIKRYKK